MIKFNLKISLYLMFRDRYSKERNAISKISSELKESKTQQSKRESKKEELLDFILKEKEE